MRITALMSGILWHPIRVCTACSCLFTITKTRLYKFDPLKPQFYIVKLRITGVYIFSYFRSKHSNIQNILPPKIENFRIKNSDIFFSYFCSKHRLWILVRTAEAVLTSTHNLWFRAEKWKISEFLIRNFSIFGGKIFCIFELACFHNAKGKYDSYKCYTDMFCTYE